MLTKVAVAVLILGAALAFYFVSRAGMISGEEAKELVAQGARLIDVRTPAEFSAGHIDGAANIPVDRIGEASGELGDKSQPIVLYCRSGARSGRAKGILESKGFTNVYNMGGIGRWP